MHRLTDNTVLADLLDPVSRALARVRQAAVGRTLTCLLYTSDAADE